MWWCGWTYGGSGGVSGGWGMVVVVLIEVVVTVVVLLLIKIPLILILINSTVLTSIYIKGGFSIHNCAVR